MLCYLSSTRHLKLVLGGNSTVAGFSDADWASHLHCHSILGFTYFVGLGAVSWSAKKQPIITLSSTEAEYITLTHTAKDIIWIHKLLKDLSFLHSLSLPTTLYCDNQGAIHHKRYFSWAHEAYRRSFPFYLPNYFIRPCLPCLCPDWWHDRQHFYKGPQLRQIRMFPRQFEHYVASITRGSVIISLFPLILFPFMDSFYIWHIHQIMINCIVYLSFSVV